MCIVFLWKQERKELLCNFKFILAANRDEYFNRPAKPANFWPGEPNIIGGQDQTKGFEGGAWLAMTKFGKLGCLTNIRTDDLHADVESQKRSRGTLVSNYVKSSIDAASYLKLLTEEKDLYRPFNILAGNVLGDLLYLNNVDDQLAVPLKKGFSGMTNSVLNCEWLKLKHGMQNFKDAIQKSTSRETLIENLLTSLCDKKRFFPDPAITVKNSKNESLSSVFIPEVEFPQSGIYGTRTNTIILVDHLNKVTFFERTLADAEQSSTQWLRNCYDFIIDAPIV
ncbi:transport and Golgi organization 2 homolog isoform X1 [Hydractinia symbiolongicarpus]|uniref:transport and Golgi organization 2 homolog isoform X1 n=1 Tax=Hydractinia symbiolongicarpus TaxID=13093 RepID=UPI0025515EB8|nr:transport and Golgi organization 2 homolog isoform X1 [Hydractinia symbiolongicarpus]